MGTSLRAEQAHVKIHLLGEGLKLRLGLGWLDLVDVCLKNIFPFEIISHLFASLQLWLHLQEHLYHRKSLERLSDSLDYLPAVGAVLLLLEPVGKTATTEKMEAWRKLDRLVQELVADGTLVLLSQLPQEVFILRIFLRSYLYFSLYFCLFLRFSNLRSSSFNLNFISLLYGLIKVIHQVLNLRLLLAVLRFFANWRVIFVILLVEKYRERC